MRNPNVIYDNCFHWKKWASYSWDILIWNGFLAAGIFQIDALPYLIRNYVVFIYHIIVINFRTRHIEQGCERAPYEYINIMTNKLPLVIPLLYIDVWDPDILYRNHFE